MMRGLARPVSFLMAARCAALPTRRRLALAKPSRPGVSGSAPAAGTNMGNLDERTCAHEATRPSSLSRTGRARAPGRDCNPIPTEELPTRKVTTSRNTMVVLLKPMYFSLFTWVVAPLVPRQPRSSSSQSLICTLVVLIVRVW